MKGKNIFSPDDADAIFEILRDVRKQDRRTQKNLRKQLRERFKFYITDFDRSNKGFTQHDFNALISDGRIYIENGLNRDEMPDIENCQKHIQRSFSCIMDQCIWLRTCYNIFNTLYDSDDETTELLQQTSHKFFDNLNSILHQYIWLLICKLTDNVGTGKCINMTIQSLNADLCKNRQMTPEIMVLSCKLLCYRKHIVGARNKIIAHADKQTVLENRAMGQHEEKEMRQFFTNLQKYMDRVGSAIGVGPSDFSVPDSEGDGFELIVFLRHCQLMTD